MGTCRRLSARCARRSRWQCWNEGGACCTLKSRYLLANLYSTTSATWSLAISDISTAAHHFNTRWHPPFRASCEGSVISDSSAPFLTGRLGKCPPRATRASTSRSLRKDRRTLLCENASKTAKAQSSSRRRSSGDRSLRLPKNSQRGRSHPCWCTARLLATHSDRQSSSLQSSVVARQPQGHDCRDLRPRGCCEDGRSHGEVIDQGHQRSSTMKRTDLASLL